jgi:uncharacterized YigZ family protein
VSRVAREFPAKEGYGEHEDRGSRFLAWVFHAPDEASFLARAEALRMEHPRARHHCWAWQIDSAYRFNDDGEPGGTAGRPMLQVLESSGLQDLAAICVRYFGGVKLGTGGLARAYSGATARALEDAGRRTEVLRSRFDLHFRFESLGVRTELEAVFPSCEFHGGFGDDGWRGQIEIGDEEVERLRAFLAERGMRLG